MKNEFESFFRSILIFAIGALASFTVTTVFAKDDLIVGVHLGTYHFERNVGYNEFNPGAYVRTEDWTVGAYRNSERGNSAYVAYRALRAGRASLQVGAVTGYARGALTPLVVAEYALDNGLRLVWIPPAPQAGKGGVHVAFEF